ncbi:MAG: DUF3846 domain-containing protein [Oscillospiraceae bacterium]|nr:DUF3846 domain-containing protein [Oscillospiraceae bacterium]
MVEPNTLPYEKEINGLREMQAIVGGSIQAIYPYADKVAVVCNQDGLLQNLPFNRSMEGGYGGVVGNFFVCGLGEEDFISLTPEQMQTYKQKFKNAEILLGVHGNEPITLKVQAHPKDRPTRQRDKERDTPPGRG